jgi:antitoxin ParD1/3/4
MATMNVSLPSEMKSWIENQVETSGRYSNTSDYIRDLIREEQDQSSKINNLQLLVTEGLESGVGTYSIEELAQIARAAITKSGCAIL